MKSLLAAAGFFVSIASAIGGRAGVLAEEPLVDLAVVDPSIRIELRYATARNITGHALYPPSTSCLVRQGVAERLKYAQFLLRQRGYGLKIWDAYRPAAAQEVLWRTIKNAAYVGDPAKGGSLHAWGVAVDATLVDKSGNELELPTDFDRCDRTAAMHYAGDKKDVTEHLRRLQGAMGSAGFFGTRSEWWHFIATNWKSYKSPQQNAADIDPRIVDTH
ncbi:MAG: M15 family metallopeptidase [Verrucomicrobiota bacterium]|nr:M15 family metallopeptidase [Verrucomicrobiota bacterium]